MEKAEIKVEFMAPNTLQQNRAVERKFQTLKGRGRAMLNWAGLTKDKRERLWSEVMNHATKLDEILVTRNKPIMNDVALCGKQPKWIDKLKRFGEIGIVKTLKKGNMVANRGLVGMFVGYTDDHAQRTYRHKERTE